MPSDISLQPSNTTNGDDVLKRKKKRKGRSVQDMLGVITFTKYGLETQWGELLFFQVAPTNISVLSGANIEIKINRLKMLLSMAPDLEFICADSCERFDDNKNYLLARTEEETNPMIRLPNPENRPLMVVI